MVAICPNPFRDNDLIICRQIKALLESEGFETAVCPVFAEPGESDKLPDDIEYCHFADIEDRCSLALAIGGD